MKHYDFDVRIAYADTDRMGVVYYANYLVLFERGRTEFMRNLGIRYRDLEEKQRLFLPAMESHVEYLAPARYDDLIKVRTFISELGGAHLVFRYEITLVDPPSHSSKEEGQAPKNSGSPGTGALVARGSTKHAVVNLLWRPTRLPDDLRSLLDNNLTK